MAITLVCPRCTHKQKIDDDKSDKDVPCKICHHIIQPAGKGNTSKSDSKTSKTSTSVAAKTPAATPAKSKLADEEDDAKSDGVQTGPPPVKSGGKSSTASKKRKTDDDDDDDDDDRPASSRNRKKKTEESSSSTLWLALGGGGAFVLLLLVCGGVGLGGYYFFAAGDNPGKIAQIDPPPIEPPPPPDGFPNPPAIVFPPDVFKGNPIQQQNLDPGNPNEIKRVVQLLQGAPQDRGPAFAWLERADPNHPRRSEVAKLLETMVDEQVKQPFSNNSFFPAYFRWATKDNAPSLIRLAESDAFTPWDNERRQKSMQALGKMKEVGGAHAMARRLGNAFEGQVASNSLIEMGSIAQPIVVKYLNHQDGNVRNAARNVLQSYNTPASVIATECIADLASADQGRRGAAMQWLGQTPADPAQKSAVAKALNKSLVDDQNALRNQDLVKALEKWGTADNVPVLLKNFNHQDGWTREPTRKMVIALNPQPGVIIAQCITDLDSFEQGRRNGALEWFAQNQPDPQRRAEVARALNKSIENEGSFNNGNLTKALESWGTADNVPKLVPILDGARLGRGDVVRILGKIRDPNGLDALARRLSNFFDGNEVRKSLKESGPLAEAAVLRVMVGTTDNNTRIACARFLGEIGTRNMSLPLLLQTAQRFPQDRNLTTTVQTSMAAISMRP